MGVIEPTEVQREAIPKAMGGASLAIQCYTGSGKVCTCSLCKPYHVAAPNQLSQFLQSSIWKLWPGMQTLAYMLPVLSLALRKAEAEFEQLATMGKAHTAGMLHMATLPHRAPLVYAFMWRTGLWDESPGEALGASRVDARIPRRRYPYTSWQGVPRVQDADLLVTDTLTVRLCPVRLQARYRQW